MAAISLGLMLMCAAFAIDKGMLYLERRSAQGAVDLAAIAGAADLDNAMDLVRLSLAANGITSEDGLTVTLGKYEPDASVEPDNRFKPDLTPANAIQVDLRFPGSLYFANVFGLSRPNISVSAVAANTSGATFAIGSRLVRFEDGILNAILSGLTGSNIRLTAVDYEALADARVDLFEFMSALATEANVTAGTYDDVLDASLSFGDFVSAIATASSNQDSAVTAAISTLSSHSSTASAQVPLSQVIDLGSLGHLSVGQSSPGFYGSIGVMNLVTAALMAANAQHQLSMDLGASVPGLLDVDLKLTIGEPPQNSSSIHVGKTGQILRTSQVRLQLNTKIGGSGDLLGSVLEVPVFVEAAYGEAKLESVTCADPPGEHEVTIDARSGLVKARIGEATSSSLGDWSQPAVIESAKILTLPEVRASSQVNIGSSNYETLTFIGSEIGSSIPKSTTTNDLAGSIAKSLIANISLRTGLLGLSVSEPLGGTIKAILSDAAEPLDGVILSVFEALGIHLGEADVWAHAVRCDGAVLVH